MKMIRFIKALSCIGVLTTICCCSTAYADVLFSKQGNKVYFENEKIKGYVRGDYGYFHITEVKQSGYEKLFEGPPRGFFYYMDGNANGHPKEQLAPDTIQQSLEVIEEGPVRGQALFKIKGIYKKDKSFLPGYKLSMERRIIVYSNSSMVTTLTRFSLDEEASNGTHFAFPNVFCHIVGNKGLRYISQTGNEGEAPDIKDAPDVARSDWLNEKIYGGWLQFYYEGQTKEEKDISWIYLWDENEYRTNGITWKRGAGEKILKYRQFHLSQNWSKQCEINLPITNIYAPEIKINGEYLAKYCYDRYHANGKPKGTDINFAWSDKDKKEGVITVKETAGFERKNTVLEITVGLDAEALDTAKIVNIASGEDVNSQAGFSDDGSNTLVFELPALKVKEEIKLKLSVIRGEEYL